jgi:hypothetical protein
VWWWTGAEWKPAISPDRLWRWNGQAWVPLQVPPTQASGAGVAIGVVASAIIVVFLVSLVTIVTLLTMGNQIKNVFSNVVAALGS